MLMRLVPIIVNFWNVNSKCLTFLHIINLAQGSTVVVLFIYEHSIDSADVGLLQMSFIYSGR